MPEPLLLSLLSLLSLAAMIGVAIYGRPRRTAGGGPSRERSLKPIFVLAAVAIAIGAVGLPALTILKDRKSARQVLGVELTDVEYRGRQVFGSTCARCHSLVGLGTTAHLGPRLDRRLGAIPLADQTARRALVANAIRYGRDRPGSGHMPARLVGGDDAAAVAAFVARIAGR